MAVYSYKCKTCGNEFDYQQRMSDEALEHCPESICPSEHKGKGEVYRVISKNIGLVFNGKGFYVTDYASKKKSEPVAAGSSCSTGGCACMN